MRSHTVAAEGGSAAVADHDSFQYHFHDTVAGGQWLCEQDVVDDLRRLPNQITQLELWRADMEPIARMVASTYVASLGMKNRAHRRCR
ncbi:FAD-binding protein [Shigella flexneri]